MHFIHREGLNFNAVLVKPGVICLSINAHTPIVSTQHS